MGRRPHPKSMARFKKVKNITEHFYKMFMGVLQKIKNLEAYSTKPNTNIKLPFTIIAREGNFF